MNSANKINERLAWIEHSGINILFADYSGLDEDSFVRQIETNKTDVIAEAKKLGEKRLLFLTDVSDTTFSEKVMWAFRELAELIDPYLLAGAVVGISGVRRIAFDMFNKLMAVKRRSFSSLEKAKEWLVEQQGT